MNKKAKCLVALGAFIILSIIGYIIMPKEEVLVQKMELEEVEPDYIYVHIEGCIKNPGLIKIEKGKRVYELIELAGGETEDADISKINLASILSDAQKVYVPAIVKVVEEKSTSNNNLSVKPTIKSKYVNINTADSEELQKLNGIGPSLANTIIEYRNTEGYFTCIEDLMKVSGIGESKYNKVKDNITI